MTEVKSAMAFVIERAKDGGYSLRNIEVKDGRVVQMEAVMFRSEQQPIWQRLHELGEQTFGEVAWVDRIIERQIIREFPAGQRAQPPQPPPPYPQPEERLPHVVEEMRKDPHRPPQHSLVEGLGKAMRNGQANVLMACFVLSYMASRIA